MSENTAFNKEEKKDLDILNKMKKIPGGLVIIPLVIAVIIATFFPSAFQIGGYVTALFYNGNAAMMGLCFSNKHSTSWNASIQRHNLDRYKVFIRRCIWSFCRENFW